MSDTEKRAGKKRRGRRAVDIEASIPDIAKDIIVFVVRVAVAFLWLFVMLLIISFITLGYLHFKIEYMLLASGVFAVVVAVLSGRAIYRKYRS